MAIKALELAAACSNGHELPQLVEAASKLYREALEADPDSRRRVQETGAVMIEMGEAARQPTGVRILTGIPTLDRVTRGVSEGEVFTIVARPQVGKSALATQIALNAACRSERVVFFSLEMPREQTVGRLLQQATGVDDETVETWARCNWKGLTPRQVAATEAIKERIVVVDRGRSGMEQLEASMIEATAVLKGAPRLAVVDYLGLLSTGARNIPLYQRVSEAALEVKSFAKRHRVALVLLSQAGRDQDQDRSEGAGRLGLDSARDSGQVEEAADFLLTMWRPELASKSKDPEMRNIIEASLVKNRRCGKRPPIRLRLNPISTAIDELAEDQS